MEETRTENEISVSIQPEENKAEESEENRSAKIIEERKKKIAGFFKSEKKEIEPQTASELIEEKSGKVSLSEEEIMRKRKEKIVSFFKKNYNWISYIFLAIIVWIAVKIRTRNLSGLQDVTTGTWTLGPDLDPFLFLRWAKEIVANGKLVAVDTVRYSPVGFNTGNEYIFHPYLIAWFHNIASLFGSESVTHSAVLFPVVMFGLTVVAFFLFARKIFIDSLGEKKANTIALISSFFLSVMPPLLARTIAGIPEKESGAFFFLFMAFYFFLSSWKSKSKKGRIIHAVLAGLSTAGMALIWGGFAYIFLTISVATLFAFFLGQIDNNKLTIYIVWLFSSFVVMFSISDRYSISSLATSINTGVSVLILFVLVTHYVIYNTKIKYYFQSKKLEKIPKPIISLIVALVLGLVVISIWKGPSFIASKFSNIFTNLIKPATSRLIRTVAENRQPYFGEWSGSFGPRVQGFPVFFWLFFVGSIYLFNKMVKIFKKKERWILSGAYFILLVSIIFSRFEQSHTLNGENFTSLFVYFGGVGIFLLTAGFYYYRYYTSDKRSKLRSIDFSLMLLFSFFILGIVSARGAVRLIMMLVPPTSIIVSYLLVVSFSDARKIDKDVLKWASWIFVALVITFSMFAGYQFYKTSNSSASGYIPSAYNQQWQKAMQWVRENTAEDAVFGHWWDYGYWLQSIGERATVLDGGNVISYWNHFMGRYPLTGTSDRDALEFLYAHDTTHFLIDSTDIGKYAAFSTIGSDESYDRQSYIPTFLKDNQQTQENKNTTLSVYTGGISLDEDIVYEENETKIFLPAGAAGLGAVVITSDSAGTMTGQPQGVYVYQGQQYTLPLRYAYFSGEFVDFGTGVESGIFVMPRLTQSGDQVQIEPAGALLHLSKRTVKSQLARYYLYGEENEFFKVAHVESDFLIESLRSQGVDAGEFVHFNGFRGPIKIWEINYPEDITLQEEYLERSYPESLKKA